MSKRTVFVAGHRGMVGSAIYRELSRDPDVQLVTAGRNVLDLTDQAAVNAFFVQHRFDEVYLAAAKVGGIHANSAYPAEFIYENLMIQANVIHAAFQAGVQKLLFLGSSCIYPKFATQPIAEGQLLAGYLEKTNEAYAIAKIAGLKQCESYNIQYGCDYRCVMPTNLYGPGDNYDKLNSHVIPGLIRRFHEAKVAGAHTVEAWGSGAVFREFLFVDDLARAAITIMSIPKQEFDLVKGASTSHINVGSGVDISIRNLAELIAEVIDFKGVIKWNSSMPDGTPKKLLDTTRINELGWQPKVTLKVGLKAAYEDFLQPSAVTS